MASGLFWMMRHLERCENTARLVEAGYRMSLTRSRKQESEWVSVLSTVGSREAYLAKHGSVHFDTVIEFMMVDRDNPVSLLSLLMAARENARMTRTSLTKDVWEGMNEAWLSLHEKLKTQDYKEDLPGLIADICRNTAHIRGAINGTMLRTDIYRFLQLGLLIERADNTARILDTKYYVLLPSSASVGSSLDNVQWEMILRSASAASSFSWLYGGEVGSARIVDFLIQDLRLPRSIAYCYGEITNVLSELEKEYGACPPAHDLAAAHAALITQTPSQMIIETGLHEFLVDFIARNSQLSAAIERDYRFYA